MVLRIVGVWAAVGAALLASCADGDGAFSDLPDPTTTPVPSAGPTESTVQATGPTTAPIASDLGAQALLPDPLTSAAGVQATTAEFITPEPVDAEGDTGGWNGCRSGLEDDEVDICRLGEPGADFSIALIGDSHAHHWISAFAAIAETESWELQVMTKAGCVYTGAVIVHRERAFDECTSWNESVQAVLLSDPPDVAVFTGRDRAILSGGREVDAVSAAPEVAESYVSRWAELDAVGVHVVALADTPTPPSHVPECVSENESALTDCVFARADSGLAIRSAGESAAFATVWDMNRWICPRESCPVVIGRVLVYRDAHHLSDTYVRTLTPQLYAELLSIIDAGPPT